MNVQALFQEVVRIRIDLIQEEVVNLRSAYDEVSLAELGESYESEKMLYPIIVAPTETDKYELIIGSRRLRAAKIKGAEDIPAVVIAANSPLNYILMAFAENIHREDLNPFEEARVFLRLMKDYGMGVQEVARSTHKGESLVRRRLELLSLPEDVQSLIAGKELGLQYVSALVQIPDGDAQVYYANKAIADRLSVQELQVLVARDGGNPVSVRRERKLSPEKIRVRVDMFTSWVKRVQRKAEIKHLNAEERQAIGDALAKAEVEIRTLRTIFSSGRVAQPVPRAMSEGNLVERPRNDGVEWPSGDLAKITAADRPSDEALSLQLGRTIGSIRAMRHKAQSSGRKAANK